MSDFVHESSRSVLINTFNQDGFKTTDLLRVGHETSDFAVEILQKRKTFYSFSQRWTIRSERQDIRPRSGVD